MLKVQALTRRRGTCVVMWAVGTLVGEIFVVLSNEGWGGSHFIFCAGPGSITTNDKCAPISTSADTERPQLGRAWKLYADVDIL